MKFQDARRAGYQACIDGCHRSAPPLADEAIVEWLAGWDDAYPEREAWEAENHERATTWAKLPAIEGKLGGCLNCGPRPSFFPADGHIAVGFGYAGVHRDGEPVYTEPNEPENDDAYMTGAQAEALAAADPGHDWQIVMEAPLSGRTYQRHGPDQWALVEQNPSFA